MGKIQKLISLTIASTTVVSFPFAIYLAMVMPVSEDYDRGAIGFSFGACLVFLFVANLWANEEDYEHPGANTALGVLLVTQILLWFHFGPLMFVSN